MLECVLEYYNDMENSYIDRLVKSFSNRLGAAIEEMSGHTDY